MFGIGARKKGPGNLAVLTVVGHDPTPSTSTQALIVYTTDSGEAISGDRILVFLPARPILPDRLAVRVEKWLFLAMRSRESGRMASREQHLIRDWNVTT